MNKKLLILLVFTTTFLTIGAGCAKKNTENQISDGDSTSTIVANGTSDWKVYKNDTYGFEFKNPSNKVVTPNMPSNRWGTGIGYTDGGPNEKGSWKVDVKENTSEQTLQQAFDENYNKLKADAMSGADFKVKDLYISDIKVNGIDAKELYVDNFGDVGSIMVTVVNNGNVYMIAGGQKKGDLDQFLSTFKFTPPTNVTNTTITYENTKYGFSLEFPQE